MHEERKLCFDKDNFKNLWRSQNKNDKVPVLKLLDFSKVFKVSCDASHEIGGVLSQGHSINLVKSYIMSNKNTPPTTKFDAMVQMLPYWSYYLIHKEFVLNFDHKALEYINNQRKSNPRHEKWVEFLQAYTFLIK